MKQGKNKTQKNEEEIPMNVTYEPNKSSKEKNTKLAGDQKTINKEIPSLMAFFFLFLLLSFRKSLDRFAQIKWIPGLSVA